MTRATLVPLAVALATACSHGERSATRYPEATAPGAATAARRMGGGMAEMCPMSLPGTKVSAADTQTGEALTFTTSPDQVQALREKVHAMADKHNRHHAGARTGGEMSGMTGMTGMSGMPPPSRAAVEDVPDGARIVVTPNDPADLQRLQSTIRSHAEQMQQHGCGMMGGAQQGS